MGETSNELERIFNSYRYRVKYIVWSACWWKQHASEKSLNFFGSQNAKGFYSFKLEKNTKREILKLNIFYLVEKIVRFHVDCRPQIRIVYLLHFSQTCEFWSSEANRRLRFSLLSIILTDLLGNKTLLHGFKRSWFVICGFRSVLCFSVSRFVACDRNYDWRQRKTQLWSLEFACLWKAQQSLSAVRGPWIRRDQRAVGCLF